MMKKIAKMSLRALGFLFLAGFIYYAGPQISFAGFFPLQSLWVRCGLILGLLLFLITPWLIRRINMAKLLAALKTQAQALQKQSPPDYPQVAEMAQRFEAGIKTFKTRLPGLRLYDLPWYLLIGPPGSGKTTALMNSGHQFPLEDRFGARPLQGVGGTRHCDWWFTDQAVLIDTAGRYVVQDSDQAADQAEWFSFLRLLRKYRKRRPVNGVLIAISLMEVVNTDETHRLKQACLIKERLQELTDHFKVRLPVYFILTKLDQVSGFVEFFDDLRQAERNQVWGFSFDPQGMRPWEAFNREFDRLHEQLNRRVSARLAQETDPERRAMILDFPRCWAQGREDIQRFLNNIFGAPDFASQTQVWLRGVYFTSGTQEGTPLDRLMASLSDHFQIKSNALPQQNFSTGKGYFLQDLQTRLIFKEAGLAGSNPRLERKIRWLHQTAIACAAVASLAVLLAWTKGYSNTRNLIERVDAQVRQLEEKLAGKPEGASRFDLLSQARHLVHISTRPAWYFGLSQSDKLSAQAQALYERLLTAWLLPDLLTQLDARLMQFNLPAEVRYEAFKTWLMMRTPEHYDPRLAETHLGSLMPETTEHLSTLLAAYSPRSDLKNPDGVEQIRQALASQPLDEWLYERIKDFTESQLRAAGDSGFSIFQSAGASSADVFVRKSGLALNEGLSPLYSRKGFVAFMQALEQQSTPLMEERQWVLNETYQDKDKAEALARLRQMYFTDYANAYTTLLNDLTLAPFDSAQSAAQALDQLSDETQSPLVKLLEGVRDETDLSDPIKEPFAWLHAMLQSQENQPMPVKSLLDRMGQMAGFMATVNLSGAALSPAKAQEGRSLAQKAMLESAHQPPWMSELMQTVAEQSSVVIDGGVRSELNELWRAGPLTYCKTAIAQRYPVRSQAGEVIRLNDFNQFFGYGGMLDQFYQQNVRTEDLKMLSASGKRMFDQADRIRRGYFPFGEDRVKVNFSFTPIRMDQDMGRFLLNFEGQTVSYDHGPIRARQLVWPGPKPEEGLMIQINLINGEVVTESLPGVWSWRKLIENARASNRSDQEAFDAFYVVKGHRIDYTITAHSAYNPFARNDLAAFKCVERL